MSTPLIIPLNAGVPTLLIELYLYILELSEPHPDGRTAVQWLKICRAISHWVRRAPRYRALRNRLHKHVQWFRDDSMNRFCQVETKGRASQLFLSDLTRRETMCRNIKNAFYRRYKIAQDDVKLFDAFCAKFLTYSAVCTHLHAIFNIPECINLSELQMWERTMPDFLSFTVVVNTTRNTTMNMFSYCRHDINRWFERREYDWSIVALKFKIGICHHGNPDKISLAKLCLPFKPKYMCVTDIIRYTKPWVQCVQLGWAVPHVYFDYNLDLWMRKKYGSGEPPKVVEADTVLAETAVGPIRLTPRHYKTRDESRKIDVHLLWFNKTVTLHAPIKI